MTGSQTTPDPVRLDDLADPVIPAAAQETLALLRAYGGSIALEPDAMMAEAVARSGLS